GALAVAKKLFQRGYNVFVLDVSGVRPGLNANLRFHPDDRVVDILRVGFLSALLSRAGFAALSVFFSPYHSVSDRARRALVTGEFHEIYVRADVATCEARVPKGLYMKARAGEIK